MPVFKKVFEKLWNNVSVHSENNINIPVLYFRHTLCRVLRVLYIMVRDDNVGDFNFGSQTSGDIFLGDRHYGEFIVV